MPQQASGRTLAPMDSDVLVRADLPPVDRADRAVPAAAAARERRGSYLRGAVAMAPWLAGIVPFGLVVGVTIGGSDVPAPAGLATGVTIYGGSAQLTAIRALGEGTAVVAAVAGVLAVNARLVLYSAAMAPHWRGTSPWFRALASYLLVDPSYAVGTEGYGRQAPLLAHRHYLGAALTLWVAWQAAILAGFLAGAAMPAGLRLQYAVPLFLVAQVAGKARTRPAAVAGAVGAAVAVVARAHPLGMLAAVVAGVAAGGALERRPA